MILKPTDQEYAEFYRDYISKVLDSNDIIGYLEIQTKRVVQLFRTITPSQSNFQYQPGKWSVKEVIGHLVDSERVFGYRAMCIARRETQSLPGFEQDDYVRVANFAYRNLDSLIDEFQHIRQANITLFNSLDEETGKLMGTANGTPVSVRALVYIIAGHTDHHINILKERYLS